jgi:hypothetical protein
VDAETSDIAGCILGIDPSNDIIRIRMLNARSTALPTSRTNKKGQFSFKDVPDGDYVLIATQDQRILAMRAIRLPSDAPIVVDVEPFKTTGFRSVEY